MSVIISHLNSARTLEKCIFSLLNQDYSAELTTIIVVDGGSTDGSVELVQKFVARNLVQFRIPGATESMGQIFGAQNSSSDIIMFTNSDVYVPHSWIRKHVGWLEKGYDLVGGKVFWGGDKFAFTWNTPYPKGPQLVQKQGMGLGFSNCSVKRDTLIRSGGIKNLISQQDTEFAFRVVRQGGKMILDPDIEVYHDHPLKTFNACFRRSYLYTRNHVVVMRATYGKLLIGSQSLSTISVPSVTKEFLKEWLGINGVRAYFEHYRRAMQEGILISLPRFLFIRLFSTKLGQALGALVGAVMPRRLLIESVANAH